VVTVGRTVRFPGTVATTEQRGPDGGDGWEDGAVLRRGSDGGRCDGRAYDAVATMTTVEVVGEVAALSRRWRRSRMAQFPGRL
jgi:hypothetical protein